MEETLESLLSGRSRTPKEINFAAVEAQGDRREAVAHGR